MKKIKKAVAKSIGHCAKSMAVLACCAASAFGGYQTKEPKNIFKK